MTKTAITNAAFSFRNTYDLANIHRLACRQQTPKDRETNRVTAGCKFITQFYRKLQAMKTTRIATTLLIFALTLNASAEDTAKAAANTVPVELSAVIIDDHTGDVVNTDGIQPLVMPDLVELINAVLDKAKPVTLMHIEVDDFAENSPVNRMTFVPFSVAKPPTAPSPDLPLRTLTIEAEKYRKDRAEWQKGIRLYQQCGINDAGVFVRQVTATQLKVSERFDAMLAARNGRDFNRSDIVGCFTMAAKLLGNDGRRVIIINSDCIDLPVKRAPRRTALTPQELPQDIELIFCNKSHRPEQVNLFRGIPNKKFSAPSMKTAFSLLVDMLGKDAILQEMPSDGRTSGVK